MLLLDDLFGSAQRGAPSVSLFGAFFPAWLLCAAFGLIACFILRGALILVRFDDAVPMKLFVFLAFAVAIALGSWLVLFGHR